MALEWQMPEVPANENDPRTQTALEELRIMILRHDPKASFTVTRGHDLEGICLDVIVDVDDVDEIAEVVTDRLVDMQVEEGLPVYVVPEWPPERIRAYWQERASKFNATLPIPALTLP